MERKNRQGKTIIVKCPICKKDAVDNFNVDCEERGTAYFCSQSCMLKFCLDYDFEVEAEEILIELCKTWHVYGTDEIIRLVINEVTQLLKSSSGKQVVERMYKKELDALKIELLSGLSNPNDDKTC